ncbi:hypothetical protein A2U01_0106469, partial [Trifolium medium]|nr:hypothetical protein [Trifolium medium]
VANSWIASVLTIDFVALWALTFSDSLTVSRSVEICRF